MKNYSIKIELNCSKGTIAYHNAIHDIDTAIVYLQHLKEKYNIKKHSDLTKHIK